jgi:hypothetical protein
VFVKCRRAQMDLGSPAEQLDIRTEMMVDDAKMAGRPPRNEQRGDHCSSIPETGYLSNRMLRGRCVNRSALS